MSEEELKIKTCKQRMYLLKERLKQLNYTNDFNYHQEVLKLYRRYLKNYVQIQNPIPHKNDTRLHYNSNCYFYALDLPIMLLFKDCYEKHSDTSYFWLDIGEIGKCPLESLTLENFWTSFYKDLEYLGIKAYHSTINAPLRYGGFKIAIFLAYGVDYHFARQNSDGMWVQKIGYSDRNNDGAEYHISDDPRSFIKESLPYEYIKTLELVKPTIKLK